eukprot:TRINITY_DN3346_c0_g2_i1.p1 TRINITY_DN3346_c0_g2~~TRINITY_DN3346_c0_g2_i1.p1  ORF type:complete len:317 (+),score=76.37 TRINITY_DN3346_c0_g2_i1:61-1011(+)
MLPAVLMLAAAVPHNQRPGLLPAEGMWRGSTLGKGYGGADDFASDFGVPLHLYRGFKRPSDMAFSDWELEFIGSGGIYFYSLQPQNWSLWAAGGFDSSIEEAAAAIAAVAPAQVMIAPGFEPNGHCVQGAGTHAYYGTPEEYKRMYRHIRDTFTARNVTNAVFVMDYSNELHKDPARGGALYPGDGYVDWVFFNMFQKKASLKGGDGNCSAMAMGNYAALEAVPGFRTIPWGVGAWGTRRETFGSAPIPDAIRRVCLQEMAAMFSSGQVPRLHASIYFNSLDCIISPRGSVPKADTTLAPDLRALLHLPLFTANDQ